VAWEDPRGAVGGSYADTEQLGASVCGLPATTIQYGWLKKITGPTPGTGSAVATEYAYDVLGRTVGSRTTGDPAWSCVSFDARGRATTAVVAQGSTDERITATDYAVGGDPLVTSVTDPAGTITTRIDLLGRVVEYTDVWGTVTTPTYEARTGRVLSTTTTPSGGAGITQSFTYDPDGKVLTVKINGTLIADPDYASDQLLSSVAYANGTSLATITRNSYTGATDAIGWAFADASTVTDQVVRSQAGRIISNTLTDSLSTGPETSAYRFDTAALRRSWIATRCGSAEVSGDSDPAIVPGSDADYATNSAVPHHCSPT